MSRVRERGDLLAKFISKQGIKKAQPLFVNNKQITAYWMPIDPTHIMHRVRLPRNLLNSFFAILFYHENLKRYICHKGKSVYDKSCSSLEFRICISTVIAPNPQPELNSTFIKGIELNELPSSARHIDLQRHAKTDKIREFGW